jgi:hypothetical protein
MAQVLEKTKSSVIVKFTTKEFKKLSETFNEDDLSTYDIVFDEPISPKVLLETIRKYG